MKHNRIITSLALLSLFQTGTEAQENTRPNIIFVMTDDQGKNDLGCEGNSYTPRISMPFMNRHYGLQITTFPLPLLPPAVQS